MLLLLGVHHVLSLLRKLGLLGQHGMLQHGSLLLRIRMEVRRQVLLLLVLHPAPLALPLVPLMVTILESMGLSMGLGMRRVLPLLRVMGCTMPMRGAMVPILEVSLSSLSLGRASLGGSLQG